MCARELMSVVCGLLAAGFGVTLMESQSQAAPAGSGGTVSRIKVAADKAPDCSTLKSMVRSVTRGCKTNDAKAIAIYNFARLAYYHRAYPSERGGVAALKMLNVYGWSLCGGQHAALSALWRANGWKWRFLGWKGHTTVEVFYDGKWHYFDTFLKVYAWKDDPDAPGGRTVASQADIAADPSLITEQFVRDPARKVWYLKDNRYEIINGKANWTAPAFFVCGDEPRGVISGVKGRRVAGPAKSWMGIKHAEDGYNTDVNLGPGYSLTLLWKPIEGAHWFKGRKNVPGHTCGDKDYRNSPAIGPILEPYRYLNPRGARTFSSGRLLFAPDLSDEGFLAALAGKQNVRLTKGQGPQLVPADASRPASITIRLQSPYIMSRASGQAEGIDKAEISLDGGKTFKPIDLKDFSDAVGGKYDCLVKLTFTQPVRSLRLEAIVQHNRCALPYLSPGPNKVTVSVADARQLGDNRLAVTYAYCLGSRRLSYEELADRGAQLGKGHYATWSKTPTVVQKIFTAKDLPATFEINCPTPKDKHPVYPRMLFLRREVLAPGQKPLPLPAGAVEPKLGPDDELKTMPNPFHIGIARPPKRVPRPMKTVRIPLKPSHVVDKAGKVYGTDQFIKWRKDNSEAWVMLVAGELKDLPKARQIAAARLVVPVLAGHEKAPARIAAVMLKKPFKPAAAYDFKDLGDVLGTAIVPRQPGKGKYDPPKPFALDVTGGIKRIAAGDTAFHGLALRTVPDHGVDDGWTVRVNIAPAGNITLEIDVYTDKAPIAKAGD